MSANANKKPRRADVTQDAAPARAKAPAAATEKSAACAPAAAALQNPYRRIFTETPDFATLARRAYDAEKAAPAPATTDPAPETDVTDEAKPQQGRPKSAR